MRDKAPLILTCPIVAIAVVSLIFNLEIIVVLPLLVLSCITLLLNVFILVDTIRDHRKLALPIVLIILAVVAPLSQFIVFSGMNIGP